MDKNKKLGFLGSSTNPEVMGATPTAIMIFIALFLVKKFNIGISDEEVSDTIVNLGMAANSIYLAFGVLRKFVLGVNRYFRG